MIHGERVVLRAIERDDLPHYVQWLNDPAVLAHFGRLVPLSLAQEENWYEEMLQDESVRNFAVEFEGRHIGGAGFRGIDGRIGQPQLWDQGLGYDVLHTLLHFGFEQMNLNRIYLRVLASNERAIHLYEKLGFQHEGCWRQAEFRHGQYHDLLWMSVLRGEWTG
jgi:diamine N-acetyltransferase